MLHSLGWHSGYFGPAAKTIVEAGFAVSAMVNATGRYHHPVLRRMHPESHEMFLVYAIISSVIRMHNHCIVIDTDPRLLASVHEQDLQGHGMSKSASNEPRGYTAKLSNHVDDIEQFVKEALADE
jgi:hypothetical protein